MYLLSHLVGYLATLAARLRSDARPEMHLSALTIVIKLRYFDRFRIENLDRLAAHAVILFRETATFLRHRRLELLRNVDVAEIVLAVQVVHGKPLDFGDLFIVGQAQREVLVEVALENVGTVVGRVKNVLRRNIFNKLSLSTYVPCSSGTMNPWGPGRLAAPAQKNVSAPLPS